MKPIKDKVTYETNKKYFYCPKVIFTKSHECSSERGHSLVVGFTLWLAPVSERLQSSTGGRGGSWDNIPATLRSELMLYVETWEGFRVLFYLCCCGSGTLALIWQAGYQQPSPPV